jgi:hypothetical protein
MQTLFLVTAVVGAAVLVVLLVFATADVGALELHGGDAGDASEHGAHGPALLSPRALAAGAAGFGLAGLALQGAGLPAPVAAPLAVGVGAIAHRLVARASRLLTRFDRDHVLDRRRAVGQVARVHLSIPAHGTGIGKVLVELQGQRVELAARTREASELATGSAALVVDVGDDGVLSVIPSDPILELAP